MLKLMSKLLRLAFTCKAWKERMPNCICLGWASKCLLNETFSPREKHWKFVMIIEILRNVRPTRKSVLINKHSCTPKSSLRQIVGPKDHDFKRKSTEGYQLGSAGQIFRVFLRELSLQFRHFLN